MTQSLKLQGYSQSKAESQAIVQEEMKPLPIKVKFTSNGVWKYVPNSPKAYSAYIRVAQSVILRESLLIQMHRLCRSFDQSYWEYATLKILDSIPQLASAKDKTTVDIYKYVLKPISSLPSELVAYIKRIKEIQKEISVIIAHYRALCINVTDYIESWRKCSFEGLICDETISIYWEEFNYLVKILNDYGILNKCEALRIYLGFDMNPFMLPYSPPQPLPYPLSYIPSKKESMSAMETSSTALDIDLENSNNLSGPFNCFMGADETNIKSELGLISPVEYLGQIRRDEANFIKKYKQRRDKYRLWIRDKKEAILKGKEDMKQLKGKKPTKAATITAAATINVANISKPIETAHSSILTIPADSNISETIPSSNEPSNMADSHISSHLMPSKEAIETYPGIITDDGITQMPQKGSVLNSITENDENGPIPDEGVDIARHNTYLFSTSPMRSSDYDLAHSSSKPKSAAQRSKIDTATSDASNPKPDSLVVATSVSSYIETPSTGTASIAQSNISSHHSFSPWITPNQSYSSLLDGSSKSKSIYFTKNMSITPLAPISQQPSVQDDSSELQPLTELNEMKEIGMNESHMNLETESYVSNIYDMPSVDQTLSHSASIDLDKYRHEESDSDQYDVEYGFMPTQLSDWRLLRKYCIMARNDPTFWDSTKHHPLVISSIVGLKELIPEEDIVPNLPETLIRSSIRSWNICINEINLVNRFDSYRNHDHPILLQTNPAAHIEEFAKSLHTEYTQTVLSQRQLAVSSMDTLKKSVILLRPHELSPRRRNMSMVIDAAVSPSKKRQNHMIIHPNDSIDSYAMQMHREYLNNTYGKRSTHAMLSARDVQLTVHDFFAMTSLPTANATDKEPSLSRTGELARYSGMNESTRRQSLIQQAIINRVENDRLLTKKRNGILEVRRSSYIRRHPESLMRQNMLATRIQALFRGYRTRLAYVVMKIHKHKICKIVRIQRMVRGKLARKKYEEMRLMKRIETLLYRKQVARKFKAAVTITECIRRLVLMKQAKKLVESKNAVKEVASDDLETEKMYQQYFTVASTLYSKRKKSSQVVNASVNEHGYYTSNASQHAANTVESILKSMEDDVMQNGLYIGRRKMKHYIADQLGGTDKIFPDTQSSHPMQSNNLPIIRKSSVSKNRRNSLQDLLAPISNEPSPTSDLSGKESTFNDDSKSKLAIATNEIASTSRKMEIADGSMKYSKSNAEILSEEKNISEEELNQTKREMKTHIHNQKAIEVTRMYSRLLDKGYDDTGKRIKYKSIFDKSSLAFINDPKVTYRRKLEYNEIYQRPNDLNKSKPKNTEKSSQSSEMIAPKLKREPSLRKLNEIRTLLSTEIFPIVKEEAKEATNSDIAKEGLQ